LNPFWQRWNPVLRRAQQTLAIPGDTLLRIRKMKSALWSWMSAWLEGLGNVTLLSCEAFGSAFTRKINWRDLLYQVNFIGAKSQSVVLITGAFTGMVLAAQTYFQFHKVRMDTATLAVVSVSMCSELGPVLSGLMVAGRVGAAMAAELGTMHVTEQIDALRTLATHPVDYLVVPRLLATLIAMPLLTAEAIAIGIGAGYVLGTTYLGIHPAYAWHNMVKYTQPEDVITGLVKALIYGGVIALISCYKGMTCREGAEGVGRATTEAVVYCCITILVSNFFLTLFLNRTLGE
jgi:phospholipid/cholesterol/gamma-HCH transport system permease protein